jgi:hypothetical protein
MTLRLLRSQTVWMLASLAFGLFLALVVWQVQNSRAADQISSATSSPVVRAADDHASSDNGSPAVGSMSVFSRAQSARDVALSRAANVREAVGGTMAHPPAGVPADMLPGGERANSLRALMTGLGAADRSIWAIATTKGRVCSGLTDFTSGCTARFSNEITFTVGRFTWSTPVIVWGLATDNVARVDVVVAGKAHAAQMGTNAFYYEMSDVALDDDAIERLVVHYKDASQPPAEMPWGPTPDPPDLSG